MDYWKNKMRIELQNIEFFPAKGGIESYLYNVSRTLLKLGHKPSIFCTKHIPNLLQKENIKGIEVIRHKRFNLPFPFRFFNPIHYAIGLQKYINERVNKVDAFWARHPYYCYATAKVVEKKKPVIFIQATPLPRFLKLNYQRISLANRIYTIGVIPQVYLIEKKALFSCNRIVTLSKSKKKEISDFYKISTNKFSVIPPGVDLERFKLREKDKDFMYKLGIKKNECVILTVGRLVASKNISMLLRAFSKMKIKNTKLIIVGDGFQKIYLQNLAKDLNIEKRVVFTGFIQEVEKFYNIADVFVCPSIYEGFGHVFLEAMASGLPCIGIKSDYPYTIVATEEIIEDGKSGFVVKRNAIEDMAVKLDLLINDRDLRNRMSNLARSICEKRYHWENSVNRLLLLTEEISKKK